MAALFGGVTGSYVVFVFALGLLVAMSYHQGHIRSQPVSQRHARR
jgi:hypothetical protein